MKWRHYRTQREEGSGQPIRFECCSDDHIRINNKPEAGSLVVKSDETQLSLNVERRNMLQLTHRYLGPELAQEISHVRTSVQIKFAVLRAVRLREENG